MSESIDLIAECAADPDPGRRFFVELLEKKMQYDQGYLEAMHDRCMTNPCFQPLRTRWLELVGTLARRAKEAGVLREDVQPQDLGFLAHGGRGDHARAGAGGARRSLEALRGDRRRRAAPRGRLAAPPPGRRRES